MKTLDASAAAHLALESTTLAVCWSIAKRNGETITGTDHDVDLLISTGTYANIYPAGSNIVASDNRSTSDSTVDNMEVQGAFQTEDALIMTDVSVQDIESGNLSGAEVVLFLCDWQNPDLWQIVMRAGRLGEITRDSDGKYTAELRGIKEQLRQIFVRTYSQKCQVKRFGDEECKLDLTTVSGTGTVSSVTSRKRFDATLSAASPTPDLGAFRGGEFTFTSGQNAGFMREIKRDDMDDVSGHMLFWESFPYTPEIGDTFTISQGCNRTWTRCKALGNQLNFRGYGLLIEGVDALARGPT
jgi:uncharacterized phage protein (TIGR02218 family)